MALAETEQSQGHGHGFEDSPDYVQSLARGLDVIRSFDAEHTAMTLSDISEITGLSRAVVRRVLLTLAHLGYVGQRGRQFYLKPKILELGFKYLSSLDFTELALPYMEELAHSINESCSLSVLDGHDIVYVARVPVRKVMAVSLGVGARLPAFCASMGRVLLSGLPEIELIHWLNTLEPKAKTSMTKTDKLAIKGEVELARQQNYAYVEQEMEFGLCSIAVPIRDHSGKIIAALNVGMGYRDDAKQRVLKEILPALKKTAQLIEANAPANRVMTR